MHLTAPFENRPVFDNDLSGINIAAQESPIAQGHLARGTDIALDVSTDIKVGAGQFASDLGSGENCNRSVGRNIAVNLTVNDDITFEVQITGYNRSFTDDRIDGRLFAFDRG